MAQKVGNIDSDFALFTDILDDVKTREKEDEIFFKQPSNNWSNKENNTFYQPPIPPKNVNEEKTKIEMDKRIIEKPANQHYLQFDYNYSDESFNEPNTSNEPEADEENLKSKEVNLDSSSNSSEKSNSQSSDEGKNKNNENKAIHKRNSYSDSESSNLISSENEELSEEAESRKRVSFAKRFKKYSEIMEEIERLEKEKEYYEESEDIETAANENKLSAKKLEKKKARKFKKKEVVLEHSTSDRCFCKCCNNSKYIKSTFPELKDLFYDGDNQRVGETIKTFSDHGEKKKQRRKKTKKIDIQFHYDNGNKKTKLDSNLKETGNPVLLSWLSRKKKLEMEKRRQTKKEKKLRRAQAKQKIKEMERKTSESIEKVQQWIESKRKELYTKEHQLTTFLEIEKKKPIFHDQNQLLKTSLKNYKEEIECINEKMKQYFPNEEQQQNVSKSRTKRVIRPATSLTKRKGPISPPEKSISKKPTPILSSARKTKPPFKPASTFSQLNKNASPNTLINLQSSSKPSFVSSTSHSTIESPSKSLVASSSKYTESTPLKMVSSKPGSNSFKEQHLSHPLCPKGYTSIRSFTNSIVKEALEELEMGARVKEARLKRPKTAYTSKVTEDLFTNTPKPKRNLKSATVRNRMWIPPKTYDQWLAEKKEESKLKKREKKVNDYYDLLEHHALLQEQARRRENVLNSKKRVNSAQPKDVHRERVSKYTEADWSKRLDPLGSSEHDDIQVL